MNRKLSVFFIIIIFTGMLYISCSDSTPAIRTVNTTVVLDFKNKKSPCEQRLSLFVETNEIQRVEKLTAIHKKTGLEWNVIYPRKFNGKDNKFYAGSTQLAPATGENIPSGSYSVTYIDAADRECSSEFYIEYNEELCSKTAGDFPECIEGSYAENCAIYTLEGTMIFYGRKKRAWSNSSAIRRDYPLAASIRTCYSMNNGRVVVMMPEEKILAETVNTEETAQNTSSAEKEKNSNTETNPSQNQNELSAKENEKSVTMNEEKASAEISLN